MSQVIIISTVKHIFDYVEQVPVLANTAIFPFPLSQTSAITLHYIERYPDLAPYSHRNEVIRLTYKMHELNFFTLSFRKSPQLAHGFVDQVVNRHQAPGINDRYLKALEYKRDV